MLKYLFFFIVVLVLISILFVYRFLLRKKVYKGFARPEDELDLSKITIEDIDQMRDGSEFEMYLYRLLLELGYSNVYKTVGSRDFGADVVFTDREGVRTVIQAKRYGVDYPVGISAVQEVFASMRYYKAKKAMVIASTKYTESCETLAGVNYVKLIDRDELIRMIALFKLGNYEAVQDKLESEPRKIYESWRELGQDQPVIKKDHKAEQYINSIK